MDPEKDIMSTGGNLTFKVPAVDPKDPEKSRPGHALRVIYRKNGKYVKVDIPETKDRIVLSGDQARSDIPGAIPDGEKTCIVVQRLKNKWTAIDALGSPDFLFDGIPVSQGFLKRERLHLMQTQNTFILLHGVRRTSNPGMAATRTRLNLGMETYSLDDGKELKTFAMDEKCLIGSSELCGFKVEGEEYAAMIYSYKRQLFISILGSGMPGGILVDGIPVELHSPLRISEGSVIRMVACKFSVAIERGSANVEYPMRDKNSFCLLPLSTDRHADRVRFPPGCISFHIGRSARYSQMVIDSKAVSRKHAQMVLYEKHALLLDCHSSNGTFVNGDSIAKRTVRPGDIISFGGEQFIFGYDAGAN